MKKKLFLAYCTLLALFISLSGFVSAKETQDLLLQSAFLPVTLFLVYSFFKSFSNPGKNEINPTPPSSKESRKTVIIITTIFFILIVVGGRKVISPPKKEINKITLPHPTQIAEPMLEPSPLPLTVKIYSDNPPIPVYAREKPASDSAVLARLIPGAVVSCLGQEENWFQVRLENGYTGWVLGDYLTFEQEKE